MQKIRKCRASFLLYDGIYRVGLAKKLKTKKAAPIRGDQWNEQSAVLGHAKGLLKLIIQAVRSLI